MPVPNLPRRRPPRGPILGPDASPPTDADRVRELAMTIMAFDGRSGRRSAKCHLVTRPWVAKGPAAEGHRGDGAPDCGAKFRYDGYLRDEATAKARAQAATLAA